MMIYGSQFSHMKFIIIFMLITLQCTNNVVVEAALNVAAEYFNLHVLPEQHFMEENGDSKDNHVDKVSGEDQNEVKKALILENFRALLGLKSFKTTSPSPLPTIESPAPAPMVPIHVHSHHKFHPFRPITPLHRMHKEDMNRDKDRDRFTRIVISVLVSIGATFIICVIGLMWMCRRFSEHRRRSKDRLKYGTSQNSSKKVSSDSDIELSHLDSAIEPNAICVKHTSNSAFDTASCSVGGGIVSVLDCAESVKYESDKSLSTCGDNIVYFEAHSSDDESFHSFSDSYLSNVKLSNASLGSLNDKPEFFSPNVSIVSLGSPKKAQSSSCSMEIAPRALSLSKLPVFSSPRNSDSSSGSNLAPISDLPSSLPKPPMGIPPPPCPPPFSKRNEKRLKGPPPLPPSKLPQNVPLGKDGAPLPKLKPLHWDKVRAASNRSTAWDKLRSSSFEFDEQLIESLFGYNLQVSTKIDEGNSKSPSPGKHVLDPKRLQNLTILSKALNVTSEQVCDALIKGNGLCLQQLEVLVKMVPTKEEEALLSSYKGDIRELGSAERYVKAMLNIPFAFLRIEAMLYRETFEDEVAHLRKSFSTLEEACKELRSSRLFLKLLEAVLKTGNRMNVGTIRGGARAFKLDTLLKLADVKGTDGKTTLLHFVVQEIVRSEGIRSSESIMGKINQKSRSKNVDEREQHYRRMGLDLVSGLSTELCNVKKTATIDFDVLAISVSNLSDGMAKLRHLVNKSLCVDEKSGDFVHSMRSFLCYAEKNIKELEEDEEKVLVLVRKISEYFHGDVSKDEANQLRIFVIVRDFLGMLDHVCKELRSFKVPSTPNPLAPFR